MTAFFFDVVFTLFTLLKFVQILNRGVLSMLSLDTCSNEKNAKGLRSLPGASHRRMHSSCTDSIVDFLVTQFYLCQ